jgi:hypothetical protein
LPASVLATLAAYGVTTWFAVERQQQLRDRYPVESLEDRLPLRQATGRHGSVDTIRLSKLETGIEYEDRLWAGARDRKLRRLHEEKVNLFANSYGFGVGRMGMVNDDALLPSRRDGPPVPQPGPGPDVSPPDKWEPATGPGFDHLHTASLLDFLNPKGFGLVESRSRVIGFQRHGFSKVPDPADQWHVGRVDLVGLLLHPEPVAYVSANLPRMDELRAAPTRPLDPFEVEGLAALQRGEDLFVRGADRQVRMVGSIRATKQCLACHGGDRGDLLGAFSYTLRREN